jgi:hypothetical protein
MLPPFHKSFDSVILYAKHLFKNNAYLGIPAVKGNVWGHWELGSSGISDTDPERVFYG